MPFYCDALASNLRIKRKARSSSKPCESGPSFGMTSLFVFGPV
jgi:hypothetical protein